MQDFPWPTMVKPGYDSSQRNTIVQWLIDTVGLENCYWMYNGIEMHVFFTNNEDRVMFQLAWNESNG